MGHAKHTRELVPVLVYQQGLNGVEFGDLETLADVGASVTDFFGAMPPQYG
ncbi:phosphopentomutase, partial [Enterovibrio nigricans]